MQKKVLAILVSGRDAVPGWI